MARRRRYRRGDDRDADAVDAKGAGGIRRESGKIARQHQGAIAELARDFGLADQDHGLRHRDIGTHPFAALPERMAMANWRSPIVGGFEFEAHDVVELDAVNDPEDVVVGAEFDREIAAACSRAMWTSSAATPLKGMRWLSALCIASSVAVARSRHRAQEPERLGKAVGRLAISRALRRLAAGAAEVLDGLGQVAAAIIMIGDRGDVIVEGTA